MIAATLRLSLRQETAMARSEHIAFEGSLGESLAARLERPFGPPLGWALFAHCFSCSKDIHAAQRISRRLTEHGFAVLRFDFTGLGHSEGDFSNTNFTSNVQDLIKAADWLRMHHTAPGLLVGHSLGGAAVIAAAPKIAEVKAVATLCAPADADHVRHQFIDHVDDIEATGQAEVRLGGRPFTIRKQFLDDIEGQALDDVVGSMKAALLIAHSPLDDQVSIKDATRLFVAARHPKSFVSLDHADHLLSNEQDAHHIADIVGAWAARYAHTIALPDPPKAVGERASIAQETGLGGFHSWVRAGDHAFIADEPEASGGLDGGPHPYQLLCSALAACTTMTLRMYANHKDYSFGRITTQVTHERDSAGPAGAKQDVFRRTVSVDGDLDEPMREKILDIANKCPVHRTLERVSRIETLTSDSLR
jgi:putative redox protein